MKIFIRYYLFLFIFVPLDVFSQGQGDTWCFGDSANIRLVGNNFINLPSCNLNSIESSASISDMTGNLLFYCGGYSVSNYSYVNCFNNNHQLLQNGDSIMGGQSVTNGLIIIPFPDDSNKYYLFSRISSFGFGYNLYYSIIDMSQNSGLGSVIQKNILLSNTEFAEKITAVKHGNGRDWWLLTHQFSFTTDINTFSIFLITPLGISSPINQSIGAFYNHNVPYDGFYGEIQFSNSGNKLLAVGSDIIDLFDFNRCTGIISNHQNLAVNNPPTPLNGYYGCSFSPDASKIYISNSNNGQTANLSHQIFQMDLNSANIPASKTIIFSSTSQNIFIGQHQIARNNKIYIATSLGIGFPNSNYGTQNMNLSVINSPDSLGSACNYSSYSISLSGRRCYAGLPNLPNYNLGADEGSPCDTLLSLNNFQNQFNVSVYPNPTKDFLSINYHFQPSHEITFTLINSSGQTVLSKILKPNSTQQKINIKDLVEGIYFWKLTSENNFSSQGKIMFLK
ncbi:MAG: hypothetical protein BWX95_02478 [Bacteroidetes bacterium ADurb.Bin141]|nr:MAG: hypothetical protein BWX95_02478 [Bacteroidetes bacterium ADurb.Bin141]